MGLGAKLVRVIESRRESKLKQRSDSVGAFYRAGGKDLLYDLPVSTGDRVIDAGGYEGEWSAKMLARYGCEIDIFEPIPKFSSVCKQLFRNNNLVHLHKAAIGGADRIAQFRLHDNGTSEFLSSDYERSIDCKVVDVVEFISNLGNANFACVKLNIEGGEYEVLERIIDMHQTYRFKSFLIQFHKQPEGWETRRISIVERLHETHKLEWCYPMVWEMWVKK